MRNDKRRAARGVPISTRQFGKRAKRVDPKLLLDLQTFLQALEDYKATAHTWWLLHGVNCIMSDLREGLWTPLFEGIYGDNPVLPDFDSAFDLVMAQFWGEDTGWVGAGQAAAAWLIQKPESLVVYYLSALRQLKEDHPDCDPEVEVRKPHQPVVWRMFHLIKIQILAGSPLLVETEETTDERDPDPTPAPRGAELQRQDGGPALEGGGPGEALV